MATPITLTGFNNIDFKSIIDIIIKSERQPIDRLLAQQTAETNRLAAYNSLSANLSSLKSTIDTLKSPSAFGALTAASSDTSTLTATASPSATRGTFTIAVTSLARPQVTTSSARQFNDINTGIIDGGSLSFTQSGTTTNINLTGVTTLAQLRDAINSQQSGISAAIVNDGSSEDAPAKPFRLILTSATPGVANAFTINDQTTKGGGPAGAVLNLGTDSTNGTALDTEFKYNGITIKSASTNVSGAIPGLTLNLLKTGSSIVSVTDDDSSVKNKLTTFVDAFNRFNDFANAQFKPSSTGTARAPLASDPLLRGLNRQIRTYLTANNSNPGAIQNLSDLGIKLSQTGKLEIDAAALDEALTTNREGVTSFLSGASGLAEKLSSYISSFTDAGASLKSVGTRIQTTIDNYSSRIVNLESRLVLREDVLTRQFTAADQAISQLNSQASSLGSLSNQFRLF